MTRSTFLMAFVVSLLLFLTATAMAQEVRLRSGVSVQGNFVHLGDLFSNAGDKSTVRIAYAPAPGKKAVFKAQWLYNVARAHSLPWRPLNLNARSVVEREGQIIHRDEIEDKLVAALADYGIGKDVDVDFGNRLLRLFVPIDKPASVSVESVSFVPSTGRFAATIAAPADDPSAERMRIAGRVYALENLPVLNKRMERNDIIKKSDVEWVKVRSRSVRPDVIRDSADLIGQAPRRIVQSGTPIRRNQVQTPVLVPKRSIVTVLHRTPLMRLTARGQALEDGSMGDIIRVANATSKKVIEAEVTGFSQVTVRSDEDLASR